MDFESNTHSLMRQEISEHANDKFYVKLEDTDEMEGLPIHKPTQKVGWLLAAFLSLFCYTVSNYIAGTQKGDIFAGKIANSLSLGVFGIIYTLYMLKTKDGQFVKTYNAICTLLGTKPNGHQNIPFDEVAHQDTLKAIAVSIIWGLLNAVGMTALFVAFNDAALNGLNISICTAILSGNCIYALVASFTVFQDKITLFQTLGVFINLGGVLIISFGQGAGGVTATMLIGSFISSSCLGVRIILSRYCTERLDSLVFIHLNFAADFLFGIAWILISLFGFYRFNVDITSQLIVFGGGFFAAGAEIFLFIGIERGVAGAVVSMAGTNGIIVGILNWLIQGATPSFLQVIAIALTFIGILVMSLGDLILKRIRKHFVS